MTDERERLIEKMGRAIFEQSVYLGYDKHTLDWLWTKDKNLYLSRAEAALSVIEQSGGYAPAGFWIAPDEPTEEMEMAGYDVVGAGSSFVYKAMQKAAKEQKPAPTQQEGEG